MSHRRRRAKKASAPAETPAPSHRHLFIAAAFLVVLASSAVLWLRSRPAPPSGRVRIESLRPGDTITLPSTVSGTAQQLSKGEHLGLAGCFPDQRCFVYHNPDIRVVGQRWSANAVVFGEPGDAGAPFRLFAILFSDEELRAVKDYLRNPARRPTCTLPDPKYASVEHEVNVAVPADQEFPAGWSSIYAQNRCVLPPEPEEKPLWPTITQQLPALGTLAGIAGTVANLVQWFRRRKTPPPPGAMAAGAR